jgi:hypothetical protein
MCRDAAGRPAGRFRFETGGLKFTRRSGTPIGYFARFHCGAPQ